MLKSCLAALAFLMLGTATGRADPASGVVTPASPRIAPHLAGARYGQAAGAILVCFGVRVTPGAEALKALYTGESRVAFEAQAEHVLAAWKRTLTCRKSGGPNECRLSQELSCREAMREIGPEGNAIPGLIEPVKP